ncbi:MAG TPA: GrpB family protein [Terriglobales bacterium]|nr:GrpB family protein [Terriglobales bacterium]
MAEETSLPIRIVDYDSAWAERYAREADRIRAALGGQAILLEHAGSTSVPGLGAKPVVDILLVVADSIEELAYAPRLEAAGYRLTLREPHWHEHRMFEGAAVNLHVFSSGCPEIERMLVFRDWLRAQAADRELYFRTKRALAEQEWTSVQDYANAKTGVVEEILARAQTAK